MTTYRTGNNWGVTIVREGHGEPNASNCGLVDDELVAVVVNGDRDLAEWICERLNAPTPDVPYTRGAREALAEVRRRLTYDDGVVYPADAQMLRDAAAELGVDEDAPSAPRIQPESAEDRPVVPEGTLDAHSGAERFHVDAVVLPTGRAELWLSDERCAWAVEIEGPLSLAELNRRAEEHAQGCR